MFNWAAPRLPEASFRLLTVRLAAFTSRVAVLPLPGLNVRLPLPSAPAVR